MSIALVLDSGLTTAMAEGATHRRWRCTAASPKAAVRDRPVWVGCGAGAVCEPFPDRWWPDDPDGSGVSGAVKWRGYPPPANF